MNKTTKSALLSAFACPGVGHFALELNRRGWLFLILTLIGVGLLFNTVMQVATSVAAEIAQGNISLDPLDIRAAINERLAQQSTHRTTFVIGALVVLWLVALIDVIREGRKQDRASVQ